ncbi:hypothetical protein AB0F59_16040 [Micromonospora lupini]|uniref:hypothetical protein n=1 Tax=Micromonospora lupini TaxID=285679 RepID=UPI0033D3EE63
MRRKLLAGLAGIAAAVALAGPAAADTTGETIVTLTVNAAGGLSITVPATANIGNGVEGTTISGQLGPVTVLDQRGSLTPNWTVTAVSTDFVTGAGTSGERIPAENVLYWSGNATGTAGTGTFTPGQATAAQAVVIDTPKTVFSKTGGTGNNFASWNPTLLVNVPDGTVEGTYTGTVTHSVV